MSIYTKEGDEGKTSLFSGTKVPKNSLRIKAYGSVDELNSVLGVVLSSDDLDKENTEQLRKIQEDLFCIGSQLASPSKSTVELDTERIKIIENKIDKLEEELPKISSFILPGGHKTASLLHLSRSVCRRSERHIVDLNEQEDSVDSKILSYINRLGDYLFVLGRFVNYRKDVDEISWNK